MPDTAVHNPPAGGDQSQASTNDDNVNADLHARPWVVAVVAHGQVGVHGRFAAEAEANASAKATKAARPQKFVEVKVVKENDIKDGLPTLVAEVEAAEAGVESADAAPTPAPKAAAAK